MGIVQKAIDEDHNGNYQEAYRQYENSLEYFMMALKCMMLFLLYALSDTHSFPAPDEKNDKLKIIIRNKVTEYLGRAEKLKEYLARPEEARSRSAIGSNGTASGVGGKTKGGDDADDAEIKKLRAGLSSALRPLFRPLLH